MVIFAITATFLCLNESEPALSFILAQTIVKTSFNDPVDTIQTNALSSTHLLEAVLT